MFRYKIKLSELLDLIPKGLKEIKKSSRVTTIFLWTVLVLSISNFSFDAYAAKTSKDIGIRAYLDSLFYNINFQEVKSGLLRDYAVEEINLDEYNGDEHALGNCTPVQFSSLINTLNDAAVSDKSKQEISAIYKNLESTENKDPNILTLSCLCFEYDRIAGNCLSDGYFTLKNGQLYRTLKRGYPYEKGYLFACCCLGERTHTPGHVKFIIPKSILFHNCQITDLELDYGNGYAAIHQDTPIDIILKNGENDFNIKATLADGTKLHSFFKIQCGNKDKTILTRSFDVLSDTIRIDKSIKITGKPYGGISTSADIQVHYANGHSFTMPLIFVEGFDPRIRNDNPKGLVNIQMLKNYAAKLDKYNIDIVYVDWENSEEYIQANANTLIEVIKWLNKEKTLNLPNIVLGHSMGGIIARYALKKMENEQIRHNVQTYISYDAPHLGANVPIGILYTYYGIKKFLKEKKLIGRISKGLGVDNLIKLGDALAYSTSAQQMLMYSVDGTGRLNNQEHLTWQRELNALGFPKGDPGKTFKMLSVAEGSYHTLATPQKYLEANFSAGSDLLNLLPVESAVAVSLSLNDVVAGLLTLLPGKTSIGGGVDIYPADSPNKLVSHIQIKYKKTFLWTIPISRTEFSFDGYSPSGYLPDIYPSSYYDVSGLITTDKNLSIDINKNPLYEVSAGLKVSSFIPFIPTSSALAFGNGIDSQSSFFTTAPKGDDCPFSENIFIESEPKSHLSPTDVSFQWIINALTSSIIGPNVGYEGALYTFRNIEQVTSPHVIWSTSNSNIASINNQGILSVHGKGVVSIIANIDNMSFSKTIMVGMPRFVLKAKNIPGGYKVYGECIDNEFKDKLDDLFGCLTFMFGEKIKGKDIVWTTNTSPEYKLLLNTENQKATIFFRTVDAIGNTSVLQSTEVNSPNIYFATNNSLLEDSNGLLYKINSSKYSYQSGRIYLQYNNSISDEYKNREWMISYALVISPFVGAHKISVKNGGPLIRDVITSEELNSISKDSEDGQAYKYMLTLLNYQGETIQLIPFTITFTTDINK